MMKPLLLIFSLCVCTWSFAQPCDDRISSKAQRYFDEGIRLLDAGRWDNARTKLLQAVQESPEFSEARFLLAQLAYDEGKMNRAQRHIDELLEVCPNFGNEAYFIRAEVAYSAGNYAAAHADYLKVHGSVLARPEDRATAVAHEAVAQKLYALQNNPWPITPMPVPGISTSGDEYLAIISPDGSRCFYTRRYQKQSKNLLTPISVEEFSLSVRPEANGTFGEGEPMPPPFNREYKEGGPTVTADNRELFFTICTPDQTGRRGANCDIYTCVREGNTWGKIRPLPYGINLPDQWESQPSISGDGRTLYFSSSRLDGLGGLDIWKVERDANGIWGKPENLGPGINTKGNEKAPFIHSDSRTLYFASDGHPGFGGYDVLYSRELPEGWEIPVNMGIPINTPEDDLGLFVSLDGHTAYFASNRLRGLGGWDIFSFDLPEAMRPQAVVLVKGIIKTDDGPPIGFARIEVLDLETREVQSFTPDTITGEYAVILNQESHHDHFITVVKDDYTFSSRYVEGDAVSGVVEEEFDLKRLTSGAVAELHNIVFNTDEFELNGVAQVVVEQFAKYMQMQPKLRVRIEGHTDNVGDAQQNLILSRKRAESVYAALQNAGISASRLEFKGFGESHPTATNETEEGRAANRRTVFVILE